MRENKKRSNSFCENVFHFFIMVDEQRGFGSSHKFFFVEAYNLATSPPHISFPRFSCVKIAIDTVIYFLFIQSLGSYGKS